MLSPWSFKPPIWDPSRQPPSPPQPPYPLYDPRDSAEENSLPPPHRPNSTENGLPGAGALPASYWPPPQHPSQQHPVPQQIQAAASAKRKAPRASQACNSCRQLKARCDEARPCTNCREKGMDCEYREPPEKRPDKYTVDMLRLLSELKYEMSSIKGEVSQNITVMRKMDQRLTSVEVLLKTFNPEAVSMKTESIEGDDHLSTHNSPTLEHEPPIPEDKPAVVEQNSPGVASLEPRGPLSLGEAQEAIRHMNGDDIEDQPGLSIMPGKPAMPLNHTTLANLLLKWPSIYNMVQHHLQAEKINYIDEFLIRQKQIRGVLRVFGKGAGFDADVRATNREVPQTMAEAGEDYLDAASPAPTGKAWGQTGYMTPSPSVAYKKGMLNSDGNPNWDPVKVWEYVQSFKENILNIHPIIIPKELDAIVITFLNALLKSTNNKPAPFVKQSSVSRFQPTTVPLMPKTGRKKKQSPGSNNEIPNNFIKRPKRLFRSVNDALVLLVLAFGKICFHKDKILNVVRDSDVLSHNSPSVRNSILASLTQDSPPGVIPHSQSSGLFSPKDCHMRRRSSLQGSNLTGKPYTNRRNMDVVPGLEYFAIATEIVSSYLGGFNLKHVWVQILAGLYHGQLGRVLESWSYISSGSRALQVVLRPSLGQLTSKGYLLGNILAELPLPQSGVLQYESQMPYPDVEFAVDHGFKAHVVLGYMAQLYLRKQLNQVQNLLYNPDNDEGHISLEDDINRIQAMLKETREKWVPDYYRWNDGDPLATDILSARLRAKYWGSQAILYRPFLKIALNNENPPPLLCRGQPAPGTTWESLGLDAGSLSVPPQSDPRTINYARLAIDALIESTRAFHGMDDSQRIVITNVFGTAHAQWGNLLQLAACYRDKLLCRFIDTDTLSNLFMRTIAFFKMITYPTSPLTADMNILIGVARDLGFIKDKFGLRANSSFSSLTSVGPLPPNHNLIDHAYMHGSPAPPMLRTHQLLPPPPHHSMSR
ncbi:hypothetical protein F5Y15DRAFT_429547 [Xylariaceae sp. FL0016]|nr:hypothetical protein F5Y15DRAFT_429547 [Xylariaceae sp. FL0016]